jgi:type I restriction enzyme S subunit
VNFCDQAVFAIDTTYYVDSKGTEADLRWLFYALQLLELDSFSQDSAVPGLSREIAYQQRLPAIPLPEQRAIAAFLDRQTARIDAAVAEYRRLIELLQEKRAALISHAVTQGLDPDARRKDSGIEWLGEIPAHWDITSVWTLFELGRGRVISNEEVQSNPGPYPVYSSQTANQGAFGYIDTFDFDGVYLTWTTDGANAGTVFYREGKFNCTNVCGTLKAKTANVEPKFFGYALNIATSFFVRHDINPKLMNNVMARIKVQIPPFPEQRAIAAYLDCETAKIDAAVAEIETAIAHLEEYRTALISAAVTGKIDVRQT